MAQFSSLHLGTLRAGVDAGDLVSDPLGMLPQSLSATEALDATEKPQVGPSGYFEADSVQGQLRCKSGAGKCGRDPEEPA